MQLEHKYLTNEAFERAVSFLKSHTRQLEVARFEAIFEGSDAKNLLDELRKFQNGDGGFGNALEPDFRAEESSALCTSVAFQILRCHQIPESESVVREGIGYLARTLDRTQLHWRIIPKTTDRRPHAPWWNQDGREAEFDVFSLNPTAEILGYVLEYGDSVFDKGIVSQLMDRVLEELSSLKVIEMHDMLCCLRLLETRNLPPTVSTKVHDELKRLVADAVTIDPEQWKGYCLRPLQVVNDPDSPFIHGLEQSVSLNLDYEIAEQEHEGSWTPPWSWGDRYPEAWKEAKREWTGVLTFEKLLKFNRFHRIRT